MTLRERLGSWLLKRSAKFSQPGYGTGGGIGVGLGWFGSFFGGSRHDWRSEAGPPDLNSIVHACVTWKADQMVEAVPIFQRQVAGEWQNAEDRSGILDLILNPNPEYGLDHLAAAYVASHDLTGNCYLLKVRSASGKVVQLWWAPSNMIGPDWPADQSEYIGTYRYVTAAGIYSIPPTEVVHLRAPLLNPNNTRLGQAPIESVLRDIAGDNGASSLLANVLARGGVPSSVVMPKDNKSLSKEQQHELKTAFNWAFTGDERGKVAISPVELSIIQMDWKPTDLGVGEARKGAEERICAVLKVPPVVIHLATGLQNSNNKASHESTVKNAYYGAVMPLAKRFIKQLFHQLAPDFGLTHNRHRLWWNWKDVTALQENQSEKVKSNVSACGGAYLTVNEVREAEGRKPVPGGDVLRVKSTPVDGKPDPAKEEEEDDA